MDPLPVLCLRLSLEARGDRGLFGRKLRVPSDEGEGFAEHQQHRDDAALKELGSHGLLVERERRIELRELVRGDRGARRGCGHRLKHGRVGEDPERRIRGRERLYRRHVLHIDGRLPVEWREPAIQSERAEEGATYTATVAVTAPSGMPTTLSIRRSIWNRYTSPTSTPPTRPRTAPPRNRAAAPSPRPAVPDGTMPFKGPA